MTAATSPALSNAFMQKYSFDVPLTETSVTIGGQDVMQDGQYVNVGGQKFSCFIGQNSFWDATQSKDAHEHLIQDSSATIINPDMTSPIACVSISNWRHMNCDLLDGREVFSESHASRMMIAVYPRDPNAFNYEAPLNATGNARSFVQSLTEAVPEAWFLTQNTPAFLASSNLDPAQTKWVRQQLNLPAVGGPMLQGLPVQVTKAGHFSTKALQQLLGSNMLSISGDMRMAWSTLLAPALLAPVKIAPATRPTSGLTTCQAAVQAMMHRPQGC